MRTLTILWGNIMRFVALACLIVGIGTAIIDKQFGSFATIYWFLIAIFCMVTVVCTEITLTRDFLGSRKEK